ncbi:hypothetical protein LTR49_028009, partial [Elasticomyces elasticus]
MDYYVPQVLEDVACMAKMVGQDVCDNISIFADFWLCWSAWERFMVVLLLAVTVSLIPFAKVLVPRRWGMTGVPACNGTNMPILSSAATYAAATVLKTGTLSFKHLGDKLARGAGDANITFIPDLASAQWLALEIKLADIEASYSHTVAMVKKALMKSYIDATHKLSFAAIATHAALIKASTII